MPIIAFFTLSDFPLPRQHTTFFLQRPSVGRVEEEESSGGGVPLKRTRERGFFPRVFAPFFQHFFRKQDDAASHQPSFKPPIFFLSGQVSSLFTTAPPTAKLLNFCSNFFWGKGWGIARKKNPAPRSTCSLGGPNS